MLAAIASDLHVSQFKEVEMKRIVIGLLVFAWCCVVCSDASARCRHRRGFFRQREHRLLFHRHCR